MSTTENMTAGTNVAPMIRAGIEATGFRVVQFPDYLTREQAEPMLLDLQRQAQRAADRVKYQCPDWCERPDHGADEITSPGDVLHYGPDFGEYITPDGATVEDLRVELGSLGGVELTAADLRQLAADALAAAEWLETVQ